tara:strand:+ start:337 stop:1467 length:1131 start_codon:yes stop_codon:yes gene_type:complete
VKLRSLKTLLVVLLGISLSACGWFGGAKHKKKEASSVQTLPVTVMEIKKQPIKVVFQSVGSLITKNNPLVKALVTGHVVSIKVHSGAEVKKGELLMKLSDKRANIAYQKALANEKEKSYVEQRYRTLAEKGIVSKIQYQQALTSFEVAKQGLLAAKEDVERANIVSPIDGYVEHVYVSIGDVVSPGDKLASIVNSKELEARLPFSQSQVNLLKIGQPVQIFSPASPDYMLKGSIDAIAPSINPNNRSFDVIVKFDNNQNVWRIGASSHAAIELEKAGSGFVVPKESLVLSNGGDTVFVAKNGKAVAVKNVEVVNSQDGAVTIDSPDLKTGDLVIVDGAPYLSNGAPIAIKGQKPNTSASSSKPTTHPSDKSAKAAK